MSKARLDKARYQEYDVYAPTFYTQQPRTTMRKQQLSLVLFSIGVCVILVAFGPCFGLPWNVARFFREQGLPFSTISQSLNPDENLFTMSSGSAIWVISSEPDVSRVLTDMAVDLSVVRPELIQRLRNLDYQQQVVILVARGGAAPQQTVTVKQRSSGEQHRSGVC